MIDITNIITVSVSQSGVGLGEFNVNNLALFTTEAFLSNPDSDVFRRYTSPTTVGEDFGTTSEAYAQAVAVFSQQPNILAGGGELIIIPLVGGTETIATALTRTKDLVSYCGMIATAYPSGADRKTLADAVQALGDKILFLPSATYADVAGVFTDIQEAGDTRTRCLLYLTGAEESRLMAAATAGRGMSVNFDGSNTALTLNLKQLAGITADDAITQTYYAACAVAGVDIYPSINGRASYISNGANGYFDDVYNLIWIVTQLRVVGFNLLATVSTKIPQTEPGMSLIKSAFRKVCENAVRNGYVAPGAWNSSEWFGSQEDMINNILERGYYIYSQPVNLQSQTDRENREAPLVQIAIKLAGAVHSIDVILSINA